MEQIIVGELLLSSLITGSLLTTTEIKRASSLKLGSKERRPDLLSLLMMLTKFLRFYGKTSQKMERNMLMKLSEEVVQVKLRKIPKFASKN